MLNFTAPSTNTNPGSAECNDLITNFCTSFDLVCCPACAEQRRKFRDCTVSTTFGIFCENPTCTGIENSSSNSGTSGIGGSSTTTTETTTTGTTTTGTTANTESNNDNDNVPVVPSLPTDAGEGINVSPEVPTSSPNNDSNGVAVTTTGTQTSSGSSFSGTDCESEAEALSTCTNQNCPTCEEQIGGTFLYTFFSFLSCGLTLFTYLLILSHHTNFFLRLSFYY